jgi:hypothetical protein
MLAKDWVTASALCDAAAPLCGLLKYVTFEPFDPDAQHNITFPRHVVCEKIISILTDFPEFLAGGAEPVLAVYQFKSGVAGKMFSLRRLAARYDAADCALQREYGVVRAVMAAMEETMMRVRVCSRVTSKYSTARLTA